MMEDWKSIERLVCILANCMFNKKTVGVFSGGDDQPKGEVQDIEGDDQS